MLKITIKIETPKGELTYTTEDKTAAMNFLNRMIPSQQEQQQTSTQKKQQQPQQKKQRQTISEEAYQKLVDMIAAIEKTHGTEVLNQFLKNNDIDINQKMSTAQLRRIYALLRRDFPEMFKKTTSKPTTPTTTEPEF